MRRTRLRPMSDKRRSENMLRRRSALDGLRSVNTNVRELTSA